MSIGTHCLRAFFVRRIPQPRSMYLNPLRDAHARGTLTRAQARIVCAAVQTLEHIVNPLLNAHRLSFLQRLAPDTHWLVVCDDPLLFEARAQEVRASQDTEAEGGRGAPLPCRPRRCLRRDLRLALNVPLPQLLDAVVVVSAAEAPDAEALLSRSGVVCVPKPDCQQCTPAEASAD